MAKATTKLNPQDRVILFCTATGIDIARPRPAAGYDGAGTCHLDRQGLNSTTDLGPAVRLQNARDTR